MDNPSEDIVSDVEASTTESTGTSPSIRGMEMARQGKGQHGKGQGGMMHGGGQHGKGQGGMMSGHGKGCHEKDRQVVQSLDMIEARMARIEAMLEILMRR